MLLRQPGKFPKATVPSGLKLKLLLEPPTTKVFATFAHSELKDEVEADDEKHGKAVINKNNNFLIIFFICPGKCYESYCLILELHVKVICIRRPLVFQFMEVGLDSLIEVPKIELVTYDSGG